MLVSISLMVFSRKILKNMSVFVNIVLAEFSVQLFGGFYKTGFNFKTETYQAVSMASYLLNKSLKLKFRLTEFKR